LATRQKLEWLFLKDAWHQLCRAFEWHFGIEVDEALAAAICSGRVPRIGVPPGKILPVPIDEQIREPSTLDILSNELYKREPALRHGAADFQFVQIDWKALKQFVREIYLASRSSSRRPGDGTVIEAFRRSFERHKAGGKRPSKEQHIAELRHDCPGMTEAQYYSAKRELGELVLDWGKPGRIPNSLKLCKN
jgi:hypothetical protein